MYDGFDRDLRQALGQGEEQVAQFIRQTARDRGVDPWDVFEATARRRIAWGRGDHDAPARKPARRSKRRSPRRSKRQRQQGGGGGRALRRLARSGSRSLSRLIASGDSALRRTAARWGEYAYGLGHWIVHRRWPGPPKARDQAPQPPRPSPAVQAFLDGYSFRESVYLFGDRDPQIRNPADDWPGALTDFHRAVRHYVQELTIYGGSQ